MGCGEVKDKETPLLMCFFERDNEKQKEYCLKLKDNFEYSRTIRYEIKSTANDPFGVKLKIKDKIYDIQTDFVDSEDYINRVLDDLYTKLDEVLGPQEQNEQNDQKEQNEQKEQKEQKEQNNP